MWPCGPGKRKALDLSSELARDIALLNDFLLNGRHRSPCHLLSVPQSVKILHYVEDARCKT